MTRIVGPQGSGRRRWYLVAPVLLTMIAGLVFIGGALAVHDEGLFELDANVLDVQAVPGDDWSNIFDGTDNAFTSTGIVADPAPQTIFTGGGSKDDLDIPQWQHKDGSVPPKDDITNAYAAAYSKDGDTFVYFGLDRFSVQGSSDVGFWFFQGDVAPLADGTFSGQHEVGDMLVLSEFDEGGGGITIKVFKWVGTGGDEGGGTLQTLFGGATGTPADCDSVPAGDDVCANVNTAPILDADIPWDYVGKAGTRNMPAAAFFEGGINLDAFFGEAPCFSNVVAETRSSFEVNAVLKDLVHSVFELCEADISIAEDDVNDVGDTHTFTVDVFTSVAGNPTPVPDGTIVDVTLTHSNPNGVVDVISDTCASPGTVGGSCTVEFSSDEPGTITGHAEADVQFGGTTVHVSTGSGPGQNPDAFKVFVDATISISPDDVNGIGEEHTFVVAVQQDSGDGNGLVDATNGHVDFTLTDSGGAVSVLDADASTCDDAGDNLDANGECTIVFTSDTAGSVVAHASVAVTISTTEGDIVVTRATDGSPGNTGDATKEFVDGSLAWFKNDDQGSRLGGASFEVCRTHNLDTSTTPDTFVDVADVCVTVLDNSPPDADPDAGEFLLVDLILGRYTVDEVPPFPPGFEPDPDVVTVELTLEPGPKDVTISEAFVNRALYRLIVITCNTTTETLVDSTVNLAGDIRETINASQLPTGVTEENLCTLAGANYDNLTRGTYTPSVELPDEPPLFP
jgi:hypothetical protein